MMMMIIIIIIIVKHHNNSDRLIGLVPRSNPGPLRRDSVPSTVPQRWTLVIIILWKLLYTVNTIMFMAEADPFIKNTATFV